MKEKIVIYRQNCKFHLFEHFLPYFSSSSVLITTSNKENLSFSYIFHPLPFTPNQIECLMKFLDSAIKKKKIWNKNCLSILAAICNQCWNKNRKDCYNPLKKKKKIAII